MKRYVTRFPVELMSRILGVNVMSFVPFWQNITSGKVCQGKEIAGTMPLRNHF